MKQVEYDPKWAVCIECDGQGIFIDGQGQRWLCRLCGGYGSQATRIYGEKHPESIKPASVTANQVDRTAPFDMSRPHATKTVEYAVEWSDIAASPWGDILYSVEADKGFR